MTTETKTTEQTILEALRALASVCDGAVTHDARGFNGVDTHFGHELANRSYLTYRQQEAALKMLRKYRKQLADFDIELPEKPESDWFSKETGASFEPHGEEIKVPEKRGSVKFNRSWIVVRINRGKWFEETLTMVKSLPERRYDNAHKAWVIPGRYFNLVRATLGVDYFEYIDAAAKAS